MARVRQCHILPPPDQLPSNEHLGITEASDCAVAELLMWYHSRRLAAAIASTPVQHLQYLLIECYYSENVTLKGGYGKFSLKRMLQNLEAVRGIKSVHIRVLKQTLQP